MSSTTAIEAATTERGSAIASTVDDAADTSVEPSPAVSACTLDDEELREALGTSEHGGFAFVGTVTSVEEHVEQHPPGIETTAGPEPPGPVPWVTFEVERWYTADWGTTFAIFMPGLEPLVGHPWRVAGNAYSASVDEYFGQSGEADPCTSGPDDPQGRRVFDDVYGGSVDAGAGVPSGQPDPGVVQELRAAQEAWRDAEPAAYSMVLGGYSTSADTVFGADCRPGRVVVIDGTATEAVDTHNACRLDPTTVPTVDELFDAAIRVAGGEGFSYDVDPTGRSPLRFAVYDRSVETTVTVHTVSDNIVPAVIGWDEVGAAAAEGRRRWRQAALGSYQLTIDTGGGERNAYDVGARFVDGEQTMLEVNGKRTDPSTLELPWHPSTVDHLFGLIEELAGEGNVVAVFDPETGHPTDVWFDPVINGIDDELEVHVAIDSS